MSPNRSGQLPRFRYDGKPESTALAAVRDIQASVGMCKNATVAIRHDRAPTAAPIIQICTRSGLCCHASLGTQNGGYACACSTQINYVSLLLDRLLRPVRAAARTRSRCLAQVRHPQDSGIL